MDMLHIMLNCDVEDVPDFSSRDIYIYIYVARGISVVGCGTGNRESPRSIPPLATVSKFGHFCSLRDAPVHSAV